MRGKLPSPPSSRAKSVAIVLALIILALFVSLIGPGAVSTFNPEEQRLLGP
jgi:hypothetical protein